MPWAPTPLSASPLRRLEIHDGSTSAVYDGIQLDSILTATLEAQRSMVSFTNELVLQADLGLKRVLSVQLTDLIASPGDKLDIITVDRPSRHLCIRIPQKAQTIRLLFQENRDFDVINEILKRFGFSIKDGASFPSGNVTSLARSQSHPTPLASSSTMRLSCITPLGRPGSSQADSPFSFTSMLNSDVPLTEMQSLGTQGQPVHQFPQDLSQEPDQQTAPGNTYAPYRNPYQLYIGHQGNLYQPRVSSPLRNAIEVSSVEASPMPPEPNSQTSFISSFTATESVTSYRSTSDPNTSSNPWNRQELVNASGYHSSYSQESPPASQDTVFSTGNDSNTSEGADVSVALQHIQDFRELMPRTRSLPFAKSSNAKTSKSKPVQKRTTMERCPSSSIHDIIIEDNVPSDTEVDDASVSQINMGTIISQPTNTKTEPSVTCHSSRIMDEWQPMLITDTQLLDKVNQLTSKLLDQYDADICRGCDGAACAQFYLEQIDTARREFWLDQLKHINYV